MQKRGRDFRIWLAGLLLISGLAVSLSLFYWILRQEPPLLMLGYGDLMQTLRAGKADLSIRLNKVKVGHSDIRGEIVTTDLVSTATEEKNQTDTFPFRTSRVGFERDQELYTLLREANAVHQGAEDDSAVRAMTSALVTILTLTLLVAGGLLLLRWMGGAPFSFARSRAKLYTEDETSITFRDVAGQDEAIAELREVVDFLRQPEKYQALGGRIPRGVLLVGPPGTGKTLLARAVAGEAGVPFFSLSGSDFVEMFVGVGAARVRDLFAQAAAKGPCILFIDELDALGKTRSGVSVGGHDEREQTLNQLLVEMDGMSTNRATLLMAATNRPETLDPALLRPGRFDRTIVVDRPDINGRHAILKVHSRHVRLSNDVDLRRVASLTPGLSGADLANLINEAALMAARAGKAEVGPAELDEAIERGAVGLERRSRVMSPAEKQRVAYHEAGHALVASLLPDAHPVHKISIIPRGAGALGYVLSRPDEERYSLTRSELLSKIQMALGGTLAEEIIFQEISNGAANDLEQVSDIARRMVKQFGMSRLGRVSFQDSGGPAFLHGVGSAQERLYSEQTAREIDLEVRQIVDEATENVRQLLQNHRQVLESLATRLIEREVLDGAELHQLLQDHGLSLPSQGTIVNGQVQAQQPVSFRGIVDKGDTQS